MISTLESDITEAKTEIADTQVQLKRASENREKQNKEFQLTVADQRATQEILQKAVDRLQAFYASKAALVQTGKSLKAAHKASQAPPPGFGGDYKKSAGASGVIVMIQQIIADSKSVEADANKNEQDSQMAYETFVKDSNKIITKLSEEVANKADAKATADGDLVAAKADLAGTLSDLEQLHDVAGELHMSCDFTLKNFDVRQASRSQEMDALKQAKAIMSGADFGL